MKYLGYEGFRTMIAECMENTRKLITGMEAYGYSRVVDPTMNVVAFTGEDVPTGWVISHTRDNHLRFVIMPHVTHDVIECFLADVAAMQA
jgi:tyrosine decarboxylase/aspartate 1-decarboxylase